LQWVIVRFERKVGARRDIPRPAGENAGLREDANSSGKAGGGGSDNRAVDTFILSSTIQLSVVMTALCM
jgi:hypothetical protein